MKATDRMKELQEESGNITYSDPLTTFLYLLMRNEMAAGKVEALVCEVLEDDEEVLFSNGWLAQYANNLAQKIKNASEIQLEAALKQAFDSEDERKKAKAMEGAKRKEELISMSSPPEEIAGDELCALEERLMQIAKSDGMLQEAQKLQDTDGYGSSIRVPGVDDVVNGLMTYELITAEEAETYRKEIVEALAEEEAERPEDLPEAEEIAKEHTDEQKWTPEQAKEVVDPALKAYESAKKLDVDTARKTPNDEVESKWKNTHEELKKIEGDEDEGQKE